MRIVASAVKAFLPQSNTFVVFTGTRHADVLESMFKLQVHYDRQKSIQGFITDTNEFLDRYEGKKLALDNGQFIPWNNDEGWSELYSENIWPPEMF